MAKGSNIEWCDSSWTVVTGCDKVSPGCAHCYALTLAPRLKAMGNKAYQKDGDPKTSGPGFAVQWHEDRLDWPFRWQKPQRIFVTSMGDLFHELVPDDFLDRVFAVMALTPRHTYQVLTKRPERMRAYLSDPAMKDRMHAAVHAIADGKMPLHRTLDWPLPNLWAGTSVENARWRTRIDELRHVPAAVRFLSCEPLLGPLVRHDDGHDMPAPLDLAGIDWVIVGGESGHGARPMSEAWVRDIVEECRRQDVAPFVKQMGSTWSREHLGYPGHGSKIETFADDLQVREFPRTKVAA